MCHDYTPINLANGPVSFKSDRKISSKELIENVKEDLDRTKSL